MAKDAISNFSKISCADELMVIINIWGIDINKTWIPFSNLIVTIGLSADSENFVLKLICTPIGYNNSVEIKYKKKLLIFVKNVICSSWWNREYTVINNRFNANGKIINVNEILSAICSSNALFFFV